jgi:hypothetical protein
VFRVPYRTIDRDKPGEAVLDLQVANLSLMDLRHGMQCLFALFCATGVVTFLFVGAEVPTAAGIAALVGTVLCIKFPNWYKRRVGSVRLVTTRDTLALHHLGKIRHVRLADLGRVSMESATAGAFAVLEGGGVRETPLGTSGSEVHIVFHPRNDAQGRWSPITLTRMSLTSGVAVEWVPKVHRLLQGKAGYRRRMPRTRLRQTKTRVVSMQEASRFSASMRRRGLIGYSLFARRRIFAPRHLSLLPMPLLFQARADGRWGV